MIISAEEIPDTVDIILREADERECRAGGMTGAEAVRRSARTSLQSWMVTVNGIPVAFWGYGAATPLSARCYAWLLTTPSADHYAYKLARSSRRIIAWLLLRFDEVVVEVHIEHGLARRWLAWLGFEYLSRRDEFISLIRRRV